MKIGAKDVDEVGLNLVRVLVLVDQHVLKLFLVKFAHVLVLAQQAERIDEQVVVIHHVVDPLARLENALDGLELCRR